MGTVWETSAHYDPAKNENPSSICRVRDRF
nr:MAG TPA: hypothetical protein [Caudoviricetes sp.]